jgi:hypothetical protein
MPGLYLSHGTENDHAAEAAERLGLSQQRIWHRAVIVTFAADTQAGRVRPECVLFAERGRALPVFQGSASHSTQRSESDRW